MPVLLERRRTDDGAPFFASERRARSVTCLDVALVNNMPDAALESTERQFVELLDAASHDMVVRLRLYSLPGVPRGEAGRDYLRKSCFGISALWGDPPDGLIVTGTEPRTPSLNDEPYWASLTGLLDWADTNAVPSVWSCLAAHAAVLHIDGIGRVPLPHKRFGLFECTRVCNDHPLMKDVPDRIQVAHSRWNEVPLDALTARGYTILTRSVEAGVDAFVKEGRSVALFFQGHPEYDARALLREYRRDTGRYLRGERATYPEMPRGYFNEQAAAELASYRTRMLSDRREDLLAEFPSAAEAGLTPVGDSPAVRIYGNWLSYLSAQRAKPTPLTTAPLRARHTAASLAAG